MGEVDLVKIDVEGAEFDVLPGSERLAEVATVVGEVHAPPGTPESVALLATLTGFVVTTNEPGEDVPFTVFRATRAALAA